MMASSLAESVVFVKALSQLSDRVRSPQDLFERPSWLHFDANVGSVRHDLLQLDLPSVVIERLLALETRPSLTRFGSGLFISLRGINLNSAEDPVDMISLRVWLQEDLIVTVRQQVLTSVQAVRADLDAQDGDFRPQQILTRLLAALSDRIATFLEELAGETDGLEDELEDQLKVIDAAHVAELRRKIASIRRYLSPQRDALLELARGHGGILNSRETDDIDLQASRLVRYVEDLDLMRERVVFVQEGINTRMQESQNKKINNLSLLAGIFLPATFLTGVFGMNVGGLPGTESANGFYWVLGVMAVTSGLLVAWLRAKP